MGASSEKEQPLLPRNGGSSRLKEAGSRVCATVCYLLLVIILVGIFTLPWTAPEQPEAPQYSVLISAVSGLDPATDLQGRAALDPVFNVTVRLASRSRYGDCIDPRTSLQVSYSYLRVPLAGARVPELCAGPRQWKDQSVIARGKGIAVPGFLLDSLAEDMKRGEAVFEVALMRPHGEGWEALACWGKVGDASSLQAPCAASSVDDGLPVPQPGDSVAVAARFLATVPVSPEI